jgi:hypothetical protein
MRRIIRRIVRTVTTVTWTIGWEEDVTDGDRHTGQKPSDRQERTRLTSPEGPPRLDRSDSLIKQEVMETVDEDNSLSSPGASQSEGESFPE